MLLSAPARPSSAVAWRSAWVSMSLPSHGWLGRRPPPRRSMR